MTAEVMNGGVGLVNGSAELHVAQDQEPKSKLHMGNGVHAVENGVAGHEDEDSSKPLAAEQCNGVSDSGVADASGADGKAILEDPAAAASVPSAEAAPGQAGDKGILGSMPPVLPPNGDIPVFGEAAPAPAVKAPTRYDFYLVRVPRPDLSTENNRIRILDMEIAEKRERQTFIGAALRLKQAARSEAQGALRGARDRARACAAEVRKKFDEAKPLQDMLRRLNDGRKDARAQGRNLEATSEAELNDMIAQKEYRMQHERINLNEEKQLMKEIKALEASRPKVREMQALYAHVNESLGQKDAIQAQLKPLLAEAELLKEERDAAQEICKTFEAEAQVCDEAVQQLLGERAGVIQEQDTLYEERRALKTQAYQKEDDFRQYRRDYAAIQELAAGKNVEALEKFCQEQRERMHAKLNKDSAYRKAYVAANQWSTIRRFGTLDTRRLGMDEDPATLLDATAGADAANKGAGRAGGAKAAPQAKEKEGGPKRGVAAPEGASARASGGEGGEKAAKGAAGVGASGQGAKQAGGEKKGAAAQEGKNGLTAKAAPRAAAAPLTPSPSPSPAPSGPAEEVGGGAEGASSKEAEKERRREEALAKAKEAEERKRKLAERAQQRAESKAAKEAEEAAKRREKEKERKARKKAAAAADKAARVAAGEEDVEGEGEEGEGAEGGEEATGEARREGAAPGEEKKGAKGKKKGKKNDLSAEAEAALTKRQRKRLAASRSKTGREGDEGQALKKGARGGGGAGSAVWWMVAGASVLLILALLLLGSKFVLESKPVHTQ